MKKSDVKVNPFTGQPNQFSLQEANKQIDLSKIERTDRVVFEKLVNQNSRIGVDRADRVCPKSKRQRIS